MKKPNEQGLDLAAVFLLGCLKPVQQTSCLITTHHLRPTILSLKSRVLKGPLIQRPLFKE